MYVSSIYVVFYFLLEYADLSIKTWSLCVICRVSGDSSLILLTMNAWIWDLFHFQRCAFKANAFLIRGIRGGQNVLQNLVGTGHAYKQRQLRWSEASSAFSFVQPFVLLSSRWVTTRRRRLIMWSLNVAGLWGRRSPLPASSEANTCPLCL